MVSGLIKTDLTDAQSKYLEYIVTYSNGRDITEYELLPVSASRRIKVTVKYKKDIATADLPADTDLLNLAFNISYVPADEKVIKTPPSIMASERLKTNVDASKITKIEFKVDEEIPTTAIDSWDVSQDQDKSVMAYAEDDKTDNGTYKVTIVGTGNVTANENSSGLFAGFSNLKEVDLSNLDTSKVTNMSNMFNGCRNLTTIDLSGLDTSKVTNMQAMFYGCESLTTTITISSSNVTYYTNMFLGAAINDGTKITVNYTNETSSLVDQMIATKSENSNVIKGSLINN